MKIFETNSGLGYGEVAYFIKVSEKDYLCISENTDDYDKFYRVGELEEFEEFGLDEVIPEKHFMVLDNSPLAGTFLFNEFLKGLNK